MAGSTRVAPITAIESLFDAWRDADAAWAIDTVRAASRSDLPRWLAALDGLPDIEPAQVSFDAVVAARSDSVTGDERRRLDRALRGLIPWRKGPFHVFGIDIDSEWRSDIKWARIAPHIELDARRVLDVGCGNGYYGWRMLRGGARSVTGVDPSLLFALQHAAISYYVDRGRARNTVLPVALEDFRVTEPFDIVFSMGVVYHRRDPVAHVRELVKHAHEQTTLVLESLVVDDAPITPCDRYARMRNVWLVPDIAAVQSWLGDAGWAGTEVVDVSQTTTGEQRSTAWMPYESLAAALDAKDSSRTVEGYPAPKRAVIIARRR